jgi:hypothetical protein
MNTHSQICTDQTVPSIVALLACTVPAENGAISWSRLLLAGLMQQPTISALAESATHCRLAGA